MPLRRSIVSAVLALTLAMGAADVRAATFVVNTTTDGIEGDCGAAPGECTFRDAIAAATNTVGRDTIVFDPTVFPPGAPGVIQLNGIVRVIADPAGTAIDGAGAGVEIVGEPTTGIVAPDGARGGPIPVDALVFASAAGTPLANVTVANITISGFTSRGVVVCGGEMPFCQEDVTAVVLQNVVVKGNGSTGIDIRGRNVTKTRISAVAAVENAGAGIRFEVSGALVGTRIERATARDNGGAGFDLHPAGDALGTVVVDAVTVGNGGTGFRMLAGGTVAKLKLTGSVAGTNAGAGFELGGTQQVIGVTIANVTASSNGGFGVSLTGDDLLAGAVVKDTVANWNNGGIVLNGVTLVTGAKILNAKASGNQNAGIVIGADEDVDGSKLSQISVAGNGADGVLIKGARNVVKAVRANGNHGHGIHLVANGSGETSAGNKLAKSTALANDGHGILLDAGVIQATVQKNSAFAADGFDLRDENPCGANLWKQNAFVTRSPACLE